MRRVYLLAGVAAVAVCAALFFFRPSVAQVENEPARDDPPSVRTAQLPIGQVVLFSSGVGYFQREGSVEGNARVDLSFPVNDINDLLKSMVVRDLDGGHVSTVSYDSNAPVERTLSSFAINLTGNPGFGQILNQTRGEKVEVVMNQGNANQPGTMSGTVVGVEKQKEAAGKEAIEIDVLNLWCADGMRSLKLNELQRVRFLNPIMDSEFRKALETLALSHDTQKKAVSISFQGEGKREVRVGYVIENPIWKTSYRLVLDKKDKPYLQGWAIVENPTDEDWKDVKMALVSGRPISFQMDLYTPLFVPRPTVEPEQFAGLHPPTYSGAMGPDVRMTGQYDTNGIGTRLDGASADNALRNLASNNFNDWSIGFRMVVPQGYHKRNIEHSQNLNQRMSLAQSVSPVAQATRLGDFFQYALNKPVSLPRQKSAMLPIVGKEIESDRVSIYNESAQARFPLLGLRFKNTTGLHLMQGPITVFEGSNYAGDSRIFDIQPNEERLLAYAVDLGTEVNPVPHSDNGRVGSIKVVKGILTTLTKVRESKSYTIKNRNDAERVVLIEHPVRNDFKLVDTDKPVETAADFYRFQLKVAPGKTETQTVTEERAIQASFQVSTLENEAIRVHLKQAAANENVKNALTRVIEMRSALSRAQEKTAETERLVKTLAEDQARLRANLREVPSDSEIGKRYLVKLNEQETVLEQIQAEVKKMHSAEVKLRQEFEQFLANLTVE